MSATEAICLVVYGLACMWIGHETIGPVLREYRRRKAISEIRRGYRQNKQ